MKKLTHLLVGLVWTVFLFSPYLTAQDNRLASAKGSGEYIKIQKPVNDDELAAAVDRAIHDFVFYGVYDYITAEVAGGIVRLSGWTHEEWIANKMAKKIALIEGVRSVDNNIQFVTGSEDLARRAVRAIYTDGTFEKYAFSSNPPVHVVVNNNRIILAGTVANEAERERAAFLADFKTNAVTVDNQLVIK